MASFLTRISFEKLNTKTFYSDCQNPITIESIFVINSSYVFGQQPRNNKKKKRMVNR